MPKKNWRKRMAEKELEKKNGRKRIGEKEWQKM
jgi:hypothetical protein